MDSTICLILGGGEGKRLYPLTKDRSKPAVPLGGKYRLIDIPISNCLNSSLNRILILTQFNSASLNQHVNKTYRFDNFHQGFVDILAAEQNMDSPGWQQGTADAVRKNIKHIMAFRGIRYALILGGDQIYQMDFQKLLQFHIEKNAGVSVAALPCTAKEAVSFGILKVNSDHRIHDFVEKPQNPDQIESLACEDFIRNNFPKTMEPKTHLASMGIYLFDIDILLELLDSNFKDFGHDVIPAAIKKYPVYSFLYNGYWRDVGTVGTFWRANLDFATHQPQFDFYKTRIFTHARYLPPSRFDNCLISHSMVCEGSQMNGARINNSIVGIRSIIREDVLIENSVMMGADFFENDEERGNRLPLGIGENTIIRNAIIDKNARIGSHCHFENLQQIQHFDGEGYNIRDGIIIVPKNSQIPPGTIV